jgi:hypothetical protein
VTQLVLLKTIVLSLLVHTTFSHLFMLFFYLVFEVLVSDVYSKYHINFVAGSWSWVYNLPNDSVFG